MAKISDDILTAKHAKAAEFKDRLEGPGGCDFRKNAKGKIVWTCAGHDHGQERSTRHALSKAILTAMGLDVKGSLAHFDACGGYCDCEVVFNVLWMVKPAPQRKRATKKPSKAKRSSSKTRNASRPRAQAGAT